MIRVDDNYVIFSDTYGYTLAIDTHKTNKRGKPVYSNIGYYSSLPGAISAVFERKKRLALADGEHDLADTIRIVRELNDEAREMIEKAFPLAEGGK